MWQKPVPNGKQRDGDRGKAVAAQSLLDEEEPMEHLRLHCWVGCIVREIGHAILMWSGCYDMR